MQIYYLTPSNEKKLQKWLRMTLKNEEWPRLVGNFSKVGTLIHEKNKKTARLLC